MSKTKRKYRNKDWLEELYTKRRKTIYEIAKLANCSSSTIERYLHKFNIPIQYNKGRAKAEERYRDKDWLKEQYVDKGKDQEEIANEIGIQQSTISSWLVKFGIKTRNGGPKSNSFEEHRKVNKFLEGSLLGDGSLQSRSTRAARYGLGQKYREYCEWISKFLERYSIEQSGNITERLKGFNNDSKKTKCYRYTSLDYSNFKPIHTRWYGSGQKVIPQDLELSPLALRHWFIEDGGCYENNWGTKEVRFATNGFQIENVQRLAKKLAKVLRVKEDYIHVNQHRGPYISFGEPKIVKKFFDYILPLPKELESVYGYKWPGIT